MPKQKKKQVEPQEEEVQETQEDEQNDRFDEMEARLTKAFDAKFAMLQKTMEKMASKSDDQQSNRTEETGSNTAHH